MRLYSISAALVSLITLSVVLLHLSYQHDHYSGMADSSQGPVPAFTDFLFLCSNCLLALENWQAYSFHTQYTL